MADKAPKHTEIEEYIYKVLDALDKTGANTDKYKSYFENMTETQFKLMIKEYIQDPSDHFYMEMDAFENNITVEELEAASKVANVLIEDHLVLPHISSDQNDPYVSNEKVMLLHINQRRVQQTLTVKNHMSIGIDKRNPKTNQVMGDDKNTRISDMEMYQLIFQDAPNVLMEFYHPRSDDSVMKNEMLYQIQRKGSVSLDELPSEPKNKVALNYLNFLALAAGYQTDLIDSSGLLPIVAERGGQLYKD